MLCFIFSELLQQYPSSIVQSMLVPPPPPMYDNEVTNSLSLPPPPPPSTNPPLHPPHAMGSRYDPGGTPPYQGTLSFGADVHQSHEINQSKPGEFKVHGVESLHPVLPCAGKTI